MSAAKIIDTCGDIREVAPPPSEVESIDLLQQLVGGYVQVVALPRQYMFINEEAKMRPHRQNWLATLLAHAAKAIPPDDYIAGPAVLLEKGDIR